MKKVLLMPLDASSLNYGGVLQQYALQQVCQELGYRTEIINDVYRERKMLFSVKTDIRNITYAWVKSKFMQKYRGAKIKFSNEQLQQIQKRRENFENFRKNNMIFTKRCSQTDFRQISSDAYAIVCGSDQIWNPIMASYPLFLTFASPDQITIAYAASISRDSLTKREQRVMKPLLENIDYISVRENKAKDILSEVIDKDTKVVLDPTMLVNEKLWYDMTENQLVKDKYVLGYFLGNDLRIRKQAEKYALDNNLKLIVISCMSYENAKVDEAYNYISYAGAGPQEFINLIRYADCIIADSFHAAVFSIIFKKRFFILGRRLAGKIANSRLQTLFSNFNLENHLSNYEEMNNILSEEIDYDIVYSKLLTERKKSRDFLKDALESKKETV